MKPGPWVSWISKTSGTWIFSSKSVTSSKEVARTEPWGLISSCPQNPGASRSRRSVSNRVAGTSVAGKVMLSSLRQNLPWPAKSPSSRPIKYKDQSKVWASVAEAQENLSQSVGEKVSSVASPSSYMLYMEHPNSTKNQLVFKKRFSRFSTAAMTLWVSPLQ